MVDGVSRTIYHVKHYRDAKAQIMDVTDLFDVSRKISHFDIVDYHYIMGFMDHRWAFLSTTHIRK